MGSVVKKRWLSRSCEFVDREIRPVVRELEHAKLLVAYGTKEQQDR